MEKEKGGGNYLPGGAGISRKDRRREQSFRKDLGFSQPFLIPLCIPLLEACRRPFLSLISNQLGNNWTIRHAAHLKA